MSGEACFEIEGSMERKKRYPAPIRSTGPALSAVVKLFERPLRWWNALPQHQLTRRGLMELGDKHLAELGMPRRPRTK
ncbi:hypothetical protein CYK37_02725 [Mesorhizobium loti]|nr:hypothetical protein [Mesorhizobium loti]PLP61212.1 hypothetical protein CYK37_02725 [Mesorhizobium loti]